MLKPKTAYNPIRMATENPAPKPDEIISIFYPKIVVTASPYADKVDIYMTTDTGKIHIENRFIAEAMIELRKRISEQILRPVDPKGGL